MAKTDVELEDETSAGDMEQPQIKTEELPFALLSQLKILSVAVPICFAILCLYCLLQFSLVWAAYNKSETIDGFVVSPFKTLVQEYSPDSTTVCTYPTLSTPYSNSFLCNCK